MFWGEGLPVMSPWEGMDRERKKKGREREKRMVK
jgi:hypothetical protein